MTSRAPLCAAALLALASMVTHAQQTPQPAAPTHNRSGHGGHPDVASQPLINGMPPGMWWHNPRMSQDLSLTADQQKRMDDAFHQNIHQLAGLADDMHKQEALLEPMIDASTPDTSRIMAQVHRVAESRAVLEEAAAKMLLGIRTILTADQWTKLQAQSRQWQAQHPDSRRWQDPGQHPFPRKPGNGAQPPQPAQPPA